MAKVIERPDRLVTELAKVFGESRRWKIEEVVSKMAVDVVIAVTAEDIAAQAIAWASSHNEFYYDAIDIAVDSKRYIDIRNTLIDNLDARHICDYIEKKWDANASTSGDAIHEALFERYDEADLLNLVSAIVSDYNEVNNNA